VRLEEIARAKALDCDTIEIWFADEARIGQKNKITRRWAKRGTDLAAKRRTPLMICPAKQVCENRVRLCSSAHPFKAQNWIRETASAAYLLPGRGASATMRATKLPYAEYVFYFIETEAVVPDGLWYVNISV